MVASYSVSLVARVPVTVGSPTLTELAGLVFDSVSFTDELNKAGSATVSCPIASLNDTITSRLRDLRTNPCELWIYRNSTLMWAGGIETVAVSSGQTVTLGAVGLAGYLNRMGVLADAVYTNTGQLTILRQLVDTWQASSYGNYGIDTSTLVTAGTVRTISYLAKDLPNVGTKIQELAAMASGFDYWVEPDTRRLRAVSPGRGTDLTASVVLDRLNIESASVAMSVAPADLVTVATGTATAQNAAGTSTALFSIQQAPAARIAFGASWAGQNFSDLSAQGDLDGALVEFVGARDDVLFQPGVSISPRAGCQVGDFGCGDTLAYAYDAGLGFQQGGFRVAKRTVKADRSGKESMEVEFT